MGSNREKSIIEQSQFELIQYATLNNNTYILYKQILIMNKYSHFQHFKSNIENCVYLYLLQIYSSSVYFLLCIYWVIVKYFSKYKKHIFR